MRWSAPSRSRLEVAAITAALIGVALVGFTLPAQAAPAAPLPTYSSGVQLNFTLYGSISNPPGAGWGWAANNTTSPGPHLFVGYGDKVQLTLISVDGARHDWFIDYANASSPSGADPVSPDFTSTNGIIWNFTADQIGTFVYRCQYHPSSMQGLITISAPTHYSLYGSVLAPRIGWGFNATNISAPGPTLIIETGANVTLTLYSADGIPHTWFIDYDNSSSVNGGETQSAQFGGPGNPNPYNYSFVATRAGTFAYRCGIHTNQMWGMIIIVGPSTGGGAAFPIGLIPGIMLTVVIGVLFLATVYQVRATRAARLKK